MPERSLKQLQEEMISCCACPRLVAWREEVGRHPRPAYRNQRYWSRPVSSFGDPNARLLIVGLAPAAHGGNRTGRMFTGDSSGDWLFRALYKAGFANRPTSLAQDDGLQLVDAYITALCHCAPPQNRPTVQEMNTCTTKFLRPEIAALQRVRIIVCLGQLAFDHVLRLYRQAGAGWPQPVTETPALGTAGGHKPRFAHRSLFAYPQSTLPMLLCSYHPSRQNTSTKKLTEPMLDEIFLLARQALSSL
ncbi:MAG: uracil-DNA glycosylase [Firmicutes bacterium]|nr:uracil-DNA glycosylase [Bacillota bacterium]